MSIKNVGWDVDSLDKVTGGTGTNFILGRLKAMQTQAATDRKQIDPVEFQQVMALLGQHLCSVKPEEFYAGGPTGAYNAELVDALGADKSTVPLAPDV